MRDDAVLRRLSEPPRQEARPTPRDIPSSHRRSGTSAGCIAIRTASSRN